MEKRIFKKFDCLIGWVIFAISAVVYLSTLEPTASFWDCGEFIASSYKLQVGHPPGNPTFQLLGRIFTMFGNNTQAALLVNAMSAICSALCILFLFWTISHLGRRLLEKQNRELTLANAIVVWGAAAVGALVYAFSDSFWFSAVEAEVYAMSSLFTAVVFWAMLRWEECADEPYANRWIILVAYLMGLSIGVHLLNLLTIPALVFIYYYKKYPFTFKGAFAALCVSVVLIAVILYGVIPWIPKISGWFDYVFVNSFHLPFNSGMLFFVIVLLVLLFWGVWATYRKGKVFWNTALLALVVMVIGYSSFAMVVIRSSANTPTNENQPDNPFALGSYLAREQYGSAPLVYDGIFNSPADEWESTTIIAKVNGKYVKTKGAEMPKYKDQDKMFFPRMHSKREGHEQFYKSYMTGGGNVNSAGEPMPSFTDNLAFFFDYQVHYMYWRYFMWNFAGRQNDIQGTIPGDAVRGNWESGIGFIDRARLGDQRQGPDMLVHNKAKNHYYMLPLLLGFIGFFFQLSKDKRNTWVTFLLFFLTGLAILVYVNQSPYQPRERDYSYAGSFYAFAIWVGLGVMGIQDIFRQKLSPMVSSVIATILAIGVPFQMLSQNWDDHDRSNRYAARDYGYNILNSCIKDKNAVLVSFADNDTFPLWYSQEVENERTDIRIMNTSLLGTDWYIDQMQKRQYESAPLNFSIPRESYLYGTNDVVPIYERVSERVSAQQAVSIMINPKAKVQLADGTSINYLPARKLRIPVNKENALACGIIQEKDLDKVADFIDLDIPEGKNMLLKNEMIFLCFLANYQWDRPLYMLSQGGDLNVGIRDYLQSEGMVFKMVPYNVTALSEENGGNDYMDVSRVFDLLMNTYRWGNMDQSDVLLDYHVNYMFVIQHGIRQMYAEVAKALILEGRTGQAEQILDKGLEVMRNFPLNNVTQTSMNEVGVMEMIELYYFLERKEKALALAKQFMDESFQAITLFLQPYRGGFLSARDAESAMQTYMHVTDVVNQGGDTEVAKEYKERLDSVLNQYR